MYNDTVSNMELTSIRYIRMILTRKDGNPHVFKDYKLRIDGVDYLGMTDRHGLLEQAIPGNSRKGTLFMLNNGNNSTNNFIWKFDIISEESSQDFGRTNCLNN